MMQGKPDGTDGKNRSAPGGPPQDDQARQAEAARKAREAMRHFAGGRGPHGRAFIESPKNFKTALARMIRYFGPEIGYVAVVTVFIILNAFLRAVAPALIGTAIRNYLEVTVDLPSFLRQIALVFVVFLLGWLADGLSRGMMVRISNNIVFRLRSQTFSHIQTLSMPYFDKRGVGDIMSRLTNDIEMISNGLSQGFSNLVGGVFSLIGVLVAMLALNLSLSLVVLAVVPIMVVITGIIGKRVRQAYRQNQAQIGRLSGNIQESISGVKIIKAFHREKEQFSRFERINAEARRLGSRAEFTSFLFMPTMQLVTAIIIAAMVGVGGYLTLARVGGLSIGLLSAFIIYARRFFEPLRQMTEIYNVFQSALAGAERVFEILDRRPDIVVREDAAVLPAIKGHIAIKNVTFGYVEERTVLEDVTLVAHPGDVVAIVGPTGAGKTTLVNLLSRFYDVQAGSIEVDGVNIRDVVIDSLRSQMGVVLQEPFFFATTIRENLMYGNPEASDEDIRQAAKTAHADEFIRKLPLGYETVLSERGMNLSQGERQLLAIARAVLADPRILILDEATSNIDSLTEAYIQEGLLQLMQGRTSFIIAHRLSTIRNADKVVVIHDRKIIEEGTHDSLMGKGGFYAKLYAMQKTEVEVTEEMFT